MTKDTIKQDDANWQVRKIVLLRRIAHLELLTGQLKSEINAIGKHVSIELNNHMQELAMQLENVRQDLAYLVKSQDDIEQQQKNEPLIIKEEKDE